MTRWRGAATGAVLPSVGRLLGHRSSAGVSGSSAAVKHRGKIMIVLLHTYSTLLVSPSVLGLGMFYRRPSAWPIIL